jgi:pyruvate/2-oxoglutarate dehydrogenase complex dihydrolipoamide acyltransferase (E2) component
MGVEMEDQKEKTRCPSCGNVGRVSGDDPSEICEKCKAREAAAGYALASEPEEESGELADLDVAALRLIARDRGVNLRGVTRDERSLRAAILRSPAAPPADEPPEEPADEPPTDPDASTDGLAPLAVPELRKLAKQRGVDLTGLRTKADIIAALTPAADA